jgi:hypothetical protein
MNQKALGGKDDLLNSKAKSELEIFLIKAEESLKITKDQIIKLIRLAE